MGKGVIITVSLRKTMLVSCIGSRDIYLEAIAVVQAKNDGASNECSGSKDEGGNMSVTLKKSYWCLVV